jgi:protein TonB
MPTIPPLPVPPVEKRIEVPEPPRAPPPEPPRPSVITSPDWLRRPSGEDIARYYPERALRMNVDGRATLSCTVNARGTLENCSVASEEPADQDFGQSAMRMSKLFKMRPQTKDGAPVDGGTVRIPIRFQIPKG